MGGSRKGIWKLRIFVMYGWMGRARRIEGKARRERLGERYWDK